MAHLIELRQRITAVENIQTITRTLATVAGAKLSRTRRRAAGLRVYGAAIREMVLHQQAWLAETGLGIGVLSPLLTQRDPVKRIALVVLTSDRGMCGGYDLESCRLALRFWERRVQAGQAVDLVLLGRKGADYFRRRDATILHQQPWPRGGVGRDDVERLLTLLLGQYRAGTVDEVYAVYTEYFTPIQRKPRVVRVLPVELPRGADPAAPDASAERWHHEPGLAAVLDDVLAVYLKVQVWDLLLESYASEQGARMITMEEATERAETTLQECRVLHNRLRREAITTDLLGVLFASRAVEAGASAAAEPR
jgi:F-type H+-transporting ATPase subunit gamma